MIQILFVKVVLSCHKTVFAPKSFLSTFFGAILILSNHKKTDLANCNLIALGKKVVPVKVLSERERPGSTLDSVQQFPLRICLYPIKGKSLLRG